MRKKPNNFIVYIILIAIAISIGIYVLFNNHLNAKYIPDYNLDDFYVMPQRRVGVNEYKVSQVTEEDMVNTYFNTFINMLFQDINESYEYVDRDYLELKFSSNIENYRQYIRTITNNFTKVPTIKKYMISESLENTIYTVKDIDGNEYIFSVSAVMQYRVYFDDDTTKIE